MASSIYPNLVDWALRVDPDGAIAEIAEMLSQCNEMMKDAIHKPGNLPLGHKTTVRTGLPQGIWRGANQFAYASKSTTAQVEFGIGELVDYMIVDLSVARLYDDLQAFLLSESMAHVEGLSQQVQTALIYSSEAANPQQFTGFAPIYNTVNTANSQNAYNVLDAGGTGSSNTSLWLVGWGDRTAYCIHPKGSPAGLEYQDKGDLIPQQDGNGGRFEAYTTYFAHRIGLVIEDWRHTIRIANFDTTTAGLFGVTPPDIFALLSYAVMKLPTATRRLNGITESDAPTDPRPGTSPVIYVNRTLRGAMDVQAIRDKNVLLSSEDYAGNPVMTFRDVPIRVVDALTNTEARVV